MPQAEALNLLAITLMLSMSPPSTSATTQAASTQQRPRLEAMQVQVRDHMAAQDRQRAVMPSETAKVTAPSADPVVPAVVTVIPAAH